MAKSPRPQPHQTQPSPPPLPPKPSCGTCKYCEPLGEGGLGRCKLNPPSLINPAALTPAGPRCLQPLVSLENDWCGQHAERR